LGETEYAREESLIPQGSSLTSFMQILGGAIGITVGAGTCVRAPNEIVHLFIYLFNAFKAVFGNQLASNLVKHAPGLSPEQTISVRKRFVLELR
jgi:hypothetical protein